MLVEHDGNKFDDGKTGTTWSNLIIFGDTAVAFSLSWSTTLDNTEEIIYYYMAN